MAKAMLTPEQRACAEYIKGFLSEVTIVSQRRGNVVDLGDYPTQQRHAKLMAVLLKEMRTPPTRMPRNSHLTVGHGSGAARFRINPVVDRNFIVDPVVRRGAQLVGGILELWFTREETSTVD